MRLDHIPQNTAWWVIHYQGRVYSEQQNLFQGMCSFDYSLLEHVFEVGEFEGLPIYSANLKKGVTEGLDNWVSLRSLLPVMGEEGFIAASKGYQYNLFFDQHRFCGRCGSAVEPAEDEIAVHCHQCNLRQYPRVSPCVITAVRKGKQILLGHHRQNPRPSYTTLAGYVETGETLEQCVAREIFEESGIQIKNIQYVTSQPWPSPHNLMNGFIADYAGGEIVIDPDELDDAQWFDLDKLPLIPDQGTIARYLIEHCQALAKKNGEI